MRPDAGVQYELLPTPLRPADAGVGLAHAPHGQLWAEVTATSVSDLHVGSVGSSVGYPDSSLLRRLVHPWFQGFSQNHLPSVFP